MYDKIKVNSISEAVKKVMANEMELDETGLRKAAYAAHKSGETHFTFKGKKYPVKVQGEEVSAGEAIEESSPFDWKNRKSELPTKPGEKAGFDSKKISTGTVYSRKPVKSTDDTKKEEYSFKDKLIESLNKSDDNFADFMVSEKEMTDDEMKKRENIVMSMKKNMSYFKKKYGKRWKDVMYATATKQAMAKEEVEQIDEVGDTPAGRAALQSVKDRGTKAMDAWNKKPESGYSSAPRKTIRQFAGAMDADRRLRGQGITKGKEGQAQRQIDYAKKMRGEEVESLDELNKTHSDRDVKMAIGIINDKRYKGGNLTGALKAIDKMKPGLSDHPAVIRAMRTANEEYELNEKNESHTHAAHYENDKGEWTGMNLLVAKSDDDAIKQAHEKCKEGCRLSRVERHIPVKEEVESLDELSPATHQAYRKAAGTQASALDKQAAKHYASGNVKAGKELTQKANKRFSGIVKSTVKESKRPEDDTVPFVTNENKPLSRAKEMARKSMERIKNEMMGKTGTSE